MSDYRNRWRNLFCGDELDGFLLTPVGYLAPDLHVSAVEGGYGGHLPMEDFVLAVRRAGSTGLLTIAPRLEAFGVTLNDEDMAVLAAFIDRNSDVLRRHWSGQLSSFSLIARLC